MITRSQLPALHGGLQRRDLLAERISLLYQHLLALVERCPQPLGFVPGGPFIDRQALLDGSNLAELVVAFRELTDERFAIGTLDDQLLIPLFQLGELSIVRGGQLLVLLFQLGDLSMVRGGQLVIALLQLSDLPVAQVLLRAVR